MDDLIRKICMLVTRFLPKRVISRDDGAAYLERYYLFGDPGGLKYFPPGETIRWWQRVLTRLPCVYLHRFVASDSDEELHNHPWVATSLILAGGYVEERRVDRPYPHAPVVIRQAFLPWSVNYLFANTFHRVLLRESDCWSLIRIGKKVQTWGFWSMKTQKFVHWKEHAMRREKAKELEALLNSKGGVA